MENKQFRKNTQFPVKYCLNCKQVYEMDEKDVWYHNDFPTYGLKRENCCNCK